MSETATGRSHRVQQPGSTMRIVRPAPGLIAFYDGRIEGMRLHADQRNWLDDGAFSLGVCTYALVDGEDALVYDTHISLHHARIVRRTLVEAGVRRIRVVLSHWHVDHVAGNEVFADCEILAHRLTAEMLRIPVELRHADIHSLDGTVLLLPDQALMLAGDTLEDPVTYVVEPDRLPVHLRDLERMAGWKLERILPNHGALEVIAAGGYAPTLIDATRAYVEKLLRVRAEPELAGEDLAAFCRPWFDQGAIHYFAAYEAVHRRNVEAMQARES
jgi:cyclase